MPSVSEPIPHEPHEFHESPDRQKRLLARIALKRRPACIEGHSSRGLARPREPVHARQLPVNAPHPHAERRAATRLEAWGSNTVHSSSRAKPRDLLFRARTTEREDRSLHAALRALVETTEVPHAKPPGHERFSRFICRQKAVAAPKPLILLTSRNTRQLPVLHMHAQFRGRAR